GTQTASAEQQQQGGDQSAGQQGGSQGQQGQQGGGEQNGQQQGGGRRGEGAGDKAGGNSGNGQQNGSNGQGNGGRPHGHDGGSTTLHAPSGPGDHSPGKAIGSSETYVRVYDSVKTQTQGETEKVSGQINPLAPASGTIQVLGEGEKSDPTIQTYESQLP